MQPRSLLTAAEETKFHVTNNGLKHNVRVLLKWGGKDY